MAGGSSNAGTVCAAGRGATWATGTSAQHWSRSVVRGGVAGLVRGGRGQHAQCASAIVLVPHAAAGRANAVAGSITASISSVRTARRTALRYAVVSRWARRSS
jgi:hypothetical protein